MAELPANPLMDSVPDTDSDTEEAAPTCPPVAPPECSKDGCSNPGDLDKRCGKCFVARYCSRECQVAHWKIHKSECKKNRSFELNKLTEEHFMCLSLDFAKYFHDNFAGDERGYKRYKGHFDKLGSFGEEKGRGITSITVGVLEILRGNDVVKLRALTELSGPNCFNDHELHLDASSSLQTLLERAHAAGEGVTEEEVLDSLMVLGEACMWMQKRARRDACFLRAKKGFVRLLGEDSAKAINAAFMMANLIPSDHARIAELRRLWERAKISLSDEAVTFDIANQLGMAADDQGKYEEAKMYKLAALEGQRRVLGEEHTKCIMSMNNLGAVFYHLKDYENSLDYYSQALRMKENNLGKTHPSTLMTMMNMAIAYQQGLGDNLKAIEMYRRALDGYERSLGKDHEDTIKCARNLQFLMHIEGL